MKAVIQRPHENFKAGDQIEVTPEEFVVLASSGLAISTTEHEAIERVKAFEARIVKAREAKIDAALEKARTDGKLLPKEDVSATVRASALAMEAAMEDAGVNYIASLPVKAEAKKLDGREIKPSQDDAVKATGLDYGSGHGIGIRESIKAYCKLSEPFDIQHGGGIVRKGNGDEKVMAEAANIAKDRAIVLRGITQAIQAGGDFHMRDVVKAADYADPAVSNPLGVLNTGLQLAWNLGFLKNQLAPIGDITTDISNQPALYGQVVRSRYITVPGVQLKANGTAWRATTGNTTDVNVSIDTYAGIPIGISQNVSGATMRNIHNELRTPQMYGLGEYILYKIISTALNGNTRIANDGTTTSTITLQGKGDGITAGTAFSPAGGKWDLGTFTAGLPLNMDLSKFPGGDEGPGDPLQRFAWVHSTIYAGIASDTNLLLTQTIQSAVAGKNPDLVTTGRLPALGNIVVRKSQLMTDQVTVSSDAGSPAIYTVSAGNHTLATVAGIAGTRSSLMFVSRAPNDYTKLLPDVPSTAAIEMAVEPDTGITFLVVKHLDHSYETSNLRVALMFGSAIGDERQAFKLNK